MNVGWILLAAAVLAASGLPTLVAGARSRAGTVISTLLACAGAILGFVGIAAFVIAPQADATLTRPWAIPLGQFAVDLDALSILFLVPIFLIAALGSIYSLSYWPAKRQARNSRRLRIGWGLLSAAMTLVVIARDGTLFLMAWEIMAVSAFLLAAAQDHKSEVRRAAWIYLVATHIGTLCLFALFALLHASTGSFALWPTAANLPLTPLLILGLVGFGLKAGLFPLHVWLPGAHANAPSHVSAVLSGVMLKMGIYGIFRVTHLAPLPPAWWGGLLLSLGALSALVGISYAAAQQDYKRLLAYSSIENIGIIVMGLGLALLGKSAQRPDWVILGTGAALLHVLNHSLFKPLLFFGAGSLLHATHTRRIDRLGGLGKRMPLTFALFILGAIAIAGLPPLNGFVSEWALYLGLLRTTQANSAWGWAALGVPALAAVGAIALTAFIKLVGTVFQGEPRHHHARHAHDPAFSMRAPMLLLAALCLAVGIFPACVLPLLQPAIEQWSALPNTLAHWVPLQWPAWTALALAAGVGAGLVFLALLVPGRRRAKTGTWDCGYARPASRMQYTGASFVQMLADLAAWALWPRRGKLRLRELFPRASGFLRAFPDVVLDRAILPAAGAVQNVIVTARGLHKGSVQAYIVYVLIIILTLSILVNVL